MRPSLLLFAVVSLAHSAFGENWPAWRGPAGDGVTKETDLPIQFGPSIGVRWKVVLPERGNSTPIVWGDRVFLTQADGTRRLLMCLDRKDGRTLWSAGPDWKGEDVTHKTNPYCSSSPVTDGERVVAWFGSAGLWCWSVDGEEQWHVDLGPQKHIWGYGASPVLHRDLCILNFGPGDRSFIVALDKRTGKEAWRFEIPAPEVKEGPGGDKGFVGSWSTGAVVNIGGREEFLISLPGAVFSLDPKTGKEHWHCNGLNALSYAEPLVTDGVIAGFGGFGGISIGVKTGGSGNVTTSHRLWQERKNPQRIGSNVTDGKHAWLIGEPGIVECIEVATGKELWKERMQTPSDRATTWSSLLKSGNRIYAVTQASEVIVFKASAETYVQLALNAMDDGLTNSSLAASNGQLFLRTHKHLWCIGK